MTIVTDALRSGLESAAVDAEMTCGIASRVQLQTKGATFGQAFEHSPPAPHGP
jgi:hypothetical protein